MEPPSSYRISVINETDRRIPSSAIRRGVSAVLSSYRPAGLSVCVCVVDEFAIRSLNSEHRGIDESTDVLTFPALGIDNNVGDIAICFPYAEKQAKVRKVSTTQEMAFLAIHGALHLCGQDDETEVDRLEMVRKMNIAAEQAGFKPDAEWYSVLHEVATS